MAEEPLSRPVLAALLRAFAGGLMASVFVAIWAIFPAWVRDHIWSLPLLGAPLQAALVGGAFGLFSGGALAGLILAWQSKPVTKSKLDNCVAVTFFQVMGCGFGVSFDSVAYSATASVSGTLVALIAGLILFGDLLRKRDF